MAGSGEVLPGSKRLPFILGHSSCWLGSLTNFFLSLESTQQGLQPQKKINIKLQVSIEIWTSKSYSFFYFGPCIFFRVQIEPLTNAALLHFIWWLLMHDVHFMNAEKCFLLFFAHSRRCLPLIFSLWHSKMGQLSKTLKFKTVKS